MSSKPAAKRKPKPDKSPKAEYARFLETAREVGASDDQKDLDKALKNVMVPGKPRDNG